MEPLVIGLDLGTTLCKATAFAANGAAVASSQAEVTTYREHPGWAEQDPGEWQQAILACLFHVASDLGPDVAAVRGVGLSCHGPCLILTDSSFRALGRCSIWQDQRAADLIDALIEKAGDAWIGLGTPETSFGVQLMWKRLHAAEQVERAARLLDTKGYLLAFLTGQAVDEPSSSPGGADGNWPLFEALAVDRAQLAGSTPSLSVVGTLKPEIREQTGLPGGVPVVAGLNDGAAATLGAGVVALGQGIVSLSTNGVMRTTVRQRPHGSTLRSKSMFCYSYVEDMFVTGGMIKSGADSVRWLADTFYQGGRTDASVFDDIADEASKSPPGARGVMFMPFLLGMGTPNPTTVPQAAFLNLGRQHTRGDMARALLEGVALAIKDVAATFEDLGLAFSELRFTGGGSKNAVWRQIVADVLGQPLSGARADSTLGAAITAAATVGLFQDVKAAVKAMVSTSFRVEPIRQNAEFYTDLHMQYRRLKGMLGQMRPDS